MVTSGWAVINVHLQSFTKPHSQIIVTEVRFRSITFQQSDNIGTCVSQQLGRPLQTWPPHVVVSKVIRPDCCCEVGTWMNLAFIAMHIDEWTVLTIFSLTSIKSLELKLSSLSVGTIHPEQDGGEVVSTFHCHVGGPGFNFGPRGRVL